MKQFSDFAKDTVLDGEKMRIDDVVNKPITVTNYAIKNSKYPKNKTGRYLTLQIECNEGKKYVIFTGSDVLIDQMEKYGEEIPFETVIRKINRYYSLS